MKYADGCIYGPINIGFAVAAAPWIAFKSRFPMKWQRRRFVIFFSKYFKMSKLHSIFSKPATFSSDWTKIWNVFYMVTTGQPTHNSRFFQVSKVNFPGFSGSKKWPISQVPKSQISSFFQVVLWKLHVCFIIQTLDAFWTHLTPIRNYKNPLNFQNAIKKANIEKNLFSIFCANSPKIGIFGY